MSVPYDDRGLTLGDGLFETLLSVNGRLILWDEHVDRLRRGCQALALPAPRERDLAEAVAAALLESGLAEGRAAVRLTWTAGSGGRGLDRPAAPAPRLFATAASAPAPTTPARLIVSDVRRNEGSPASRLKTLSYIDNVLAREQARARGADEAVMLNNRGELACAGAANLFWVRDGEVFTPDLACGALDGIMRARVLDAAHGLGLACSQVRCGLEKMLAADSVFLTNSLIGVRVVSEVEASVYRASDLVASLSAAIA